MEAQMKINGERVRALREEKSWSQEHLATAAGLSPRTVQRVESEGMGAAETRLALAAALEVPVSALMPEASVVGGPRSLSIPAGAWLGWGTGATCAIGAVAFNYFSGNIDAEGAARSLGVIAGLLGATMGLMCALSGAFRNRGSAA
jgi:transcriptional regulator with XRE-family HTH domain